MSNTPTLAVDLEAVADNFNLLKNRHAKKNISAVVKADAYGLGVKAVSQRLWKEGCRQFFVATLAEGAALRKALPDARIGVFGGLLAGEEKSFARYRLAPVLNDVGQVERWAKKVGLASPAMLHIDTGMTRLGISQKELEGLCETQPALMKHLACALSHLACAGEPKHPKNAEQLARMKKAVALLPGVKASFANSSGHFLPEAYHFDIGRPGCALYGITPLDKGKNPMRQVACLSAPLLQVRRLEKTEDVGYGATVRLEKGARMAVAGIGYADGWPRLLSNKGYAYVAGVKVPVLGRVSMDMTALDISGVPEGKLTAGVRAEFINGKQTVDEVARASGTIGYEIFTRLGARIKRVY